MKTKKVKIIKFDNGYAIVFNEPQSTTSLLKMSYDYSTLRQEVYTTQESLFKRLAEILGDQQQSVD